MSGPKDSGSTVKQPSHPQHSLQGNTGGRLLAPDLARGFMLLIIAIAHATLWVVATETTQIGRPLGGTFVDDVTNFFSTLFVANRGLPLFALLFGYGLAMMVRRQTETGMLEKNSKQLIIRRALFLILFGFIHAVFIGGIDILFVYGISTFLIGWILFKKDKVLTYALICMSLFFVIVLPIIWMLFAVITDIANVETPSRGSLTPGTYVEALFYNVINLPIGMLGQLLMYPMLLTLLLGVWAGRKNLLDAKLHRKWLKGMAIIGTAVSIVGALPLALISVGLWITTPQMEGFMTFLQIITGVAGGLGYMGIFGLIGSSVKQTGLITRSLQALGRRSLTFYVFNETLLVILLSPVVLGLGASLYSTGALLIALFVWLLGLVIAAIMAEKRIPGPLDSLLRKLVYK
ncbi:hypothetical protein DH09_15085 [Bacillaceae bacterium JMAK1]|nr:hypothetical protein DH09_15085 [Bacillaceae bacterium JMAK1]